MAPRLNPCSYLPRRLQVVASLTAFILFCIIILGSSAGDEPYLSNVPYGPQLESGAHRVVESLPPLPKDLPTRFNPFGQRAHKPPPDQANSKSGDTKWFADFKWRNPFSSSVTFDEERSVLPPSPVRPPVYTYFDASGRRTDEKSKKAEQELLQVWRRAWWAQGFKPVVLGRPEAMKNPMYRRVQALEKQLEPDLELELMRWLAWGSMGTGILCNWLALPMAPYDDALLSYLRRGEYPTLSRYPDLDNGLFSGTKTDIDQAINLALASPSINTAKSVAECVPKDTFLVDTKPDAIAFYSVKNINSKYPSIQEKLAKNETRGDGMAMLPGLINSHLHTTWQNIFTMGIAVLKPLGVHTTSLIQPAMELAHNLSQCADSPIASSCPPNRPHCKPCVSALPMAVVNPTVYENRTNRFTIGVVPHPYTLQSIKHNDDSMDLRFVRRNTTRDDWILAITKQLLGTGRSSSDRLPDFKDIVAGEAKAARSFWFTAERPPMADDQQDLRDLDWTFGFQLPRRPLDQGLSETPVPGPERRPSPAETEFDKGPELSDAELSRQLVLFEKAKFFVNTGERSGGVKKVRKMREGIEAWNLADTEAWKFVRALNARRRIERRQWEDEEEDFQGKGMYDRWKDRIVHGD